ncbi:MAG: hypothetical protein K5886_07585 [Lachnospiraceae bacterium]|nr:hypothetical protein [Lachnospiraceae bacterium]
MDELSLKKELVKIRALAKSQGEKMSKAQIKERLFSDDEKEAGIGLSDGHLDLIYAYLKESGISLYDTEEERLASCREQDPAKTGKSIKKEAGKPAGENRKRRLKSLERILLREDDPKEVFAELYLDSVKDIARLYEGQGVLTEDLVGEGNLAVLLAEKAVEMCDSAGEADELVIRMIMDAMEKCIMDDLDNADLMDEVLKRVNRLNDAARELSEDLERKITIEELADELSLDADEIRETVFLSGDNIEYIEGIKGEDK